MVGVSVNIYNIRWQWYSNTRPFKPQICLFFTYVNYSPLQNLRWMKFSIVQHRIFMSFHKMVNDSNIDKLRTLCFVFMWESNSETLTKLCIDVINCKYIYNSFQNIFLCISSVKFKRIHSYTLTIPIHTHHQKNHRASVTKKNNA